MEERDTSLIFDIGRHIASGGQADVYLLRLRKTGGLYAGKFLREAWDPLAREQFRLEGHRQMRVAGQHVVPVIACNFDAPKPFFVLEYMPNGSLADEIARQRVFHAEQALTIARDLAVALADLHVKGVVHRDLKPGNILRGSDGRLRLNDLGIAATMTLTEFVCAPGFVGTPSYAAPEQMLGLAVPKSDVYALGVIIYELLFGTPEPRTSRISGTLGAVGSPIDVMIARMCAKEIQLRPTASETIGLIDVALQSLRQAKPGGLVAFPKITAPVQSPSTSGTDGGIWGLLFGTVALIGAAAYLSSPSGKWDRRARRYRAPDGTFTSG